MCATRDPVAHYYVSDYVRRTRMFGGINFGGLVKNSPIHQIKSFWLYNISLHECFSWELKVENFGLLLDRERVVWRKFFVSLV